MYELGRYLCLSFQAIWQIFKLKSLVDREKIPFDAHMVQLKQPHGITTPNKHIYNVDSHNTSNIPYIRNKIKGFSYMSQRHRKDTFIARLKCDSMLNAEKRIPDADRRVSRRHYTLYAEHSLTNDTSKLYLIKYCKHVVFLRQISGAYVCNMCVCGSTLHAYLL